MATHKSALKRHRQSLVRRARNRMAKSRVKTMTKHLHAAIEAQDLDAARAALAQAIPVIDKTASKGYMHKNTAARKVSRLTQKVNQLAATQIPQA